MAFLLTVTRVDEEGETVEDRMLVGRDTRAEAIEAGMAAFAEFGDAWTLVDAVEDESGAPEPLRFEPLTVEPDPAE